MAGKETVGLISLGSASVEAIPKPELESCALHRVTEKAFDPHLHFPFGAHYSLEQSPSFRMYTRDKFTG